MYKVEFLNFILICHVLMIDQTTCDREFDNYLFAGSNKITILASTPAFSTHEANEFEVKKPGLLASAKNIILGWFSKSKSNKEPLSPDIELPEGTYSCSEGKCTPVPEDSTYNYDRIKRDAAKITKPGKNQLTEEGAKHVQFIDPPEIYRDIDQKSLTDSLEKGYQEKQQKKQQKS